jgi:hypothetical protein
MEAWKFLLQKDGDRSWLPLDAPDIEILEGRYRIVARSSQPNADISIRVCHLSTEENPPKRRFQKRSGRTNQNGLMVVIPFAYLQAGLWDFSCFLTDPMSELVGDTWHYSVRLRVVSPVVEVVDPDDLDEMDGCQEGYGEDGFENDGAENDAIAPDKPILVPTAVTHAEYIPVDGSLLHEFSEHESSDYEFSGDLPVCKDLIQDDSVIKHGPTAKELAVLNVEIAQALGLSMDRLVEMTEQLSRQLVQDVFREFNLVPGANSDDGALSEGTIAPSSASSLESIHIDANRIPNGSGFEPEREPVEDLETSEMAADMVVDASKLCFVLEQEVFTVSHGQTLRIAGRLDSPKNARLTAHVWANPFLASASMGLFPSSGTLANGEAEPVQGGEENRAIAREIELHLRNPQTSETLYRDRQLVSGSLSASLLPVPFAFTCDLPPDLATHLITGEVALYGQFSESALQEDHLPNANRETAPDSKRGESLTVLTTHAFTITVDPAGLLEELEKVHATLEENVRATELADLATEFSTRIRDKQHPFSLDLSFLNLTSTVREGNSPAAHSMPTETPNQTPAVVTETWPNLVAKAQVLPPLLYQAPSEQAGKRRLELPVFGKSGVVKSSLNQSGSELLDPASGDRPQSHGIPQNGGSGGSHSDSAHDSGTVSQAGGDDGTGKWTSPSQWADLESLFSRGSSLPDASPDLDSFGNPADLVAMELSMQNSAMQDSAIPEAGDSATTIIFVDPNRAGVDDGEHPDVARPKALSEDVVSSIPLPIRANFQALNLQDRFLDRLNALASDAELSNHLRQETSPKTPETVSLEGSECFEPEGDGSGHCSDLEQADADLGQPDPMLGEVVVEDDPSWRDWARRSGIRTKSTATDEERVPNHPRSNNPLVLPEDQPVPTPLLEVLTEEIIAGLPINVRVKLPNLLPKIYVKLWVNDRQTRTLLDGPRWLVDFMPNGMEELVAFTQLTAPFGSLGIRLEAIAVEMGTQRESEKVGIDRTIEPEDIPDLFLDELDF